MNIFERLLPSPKRQSNNNTLVEKSMFNDSFFLPDDDFYSNLYVNKTFINSYYLNAWVNIAVNILIRNIARADYIIERDGVEQKSGHLFSLFHRPNERLSRYDLWKETAAWWFIEGEAFWWFGPDYGGGVPKQLYILNPRRIQLEGEGLDVQDSVVPKKLRWFYHAGSELVPIFSDEIIHFKEWNPWNPLRGVNPLVSLSLELEQDYYANKANSTLLKHNAIPQGLLKTDQTLRPEEADALERR